MDKKIRCNNTIPKVLEKYSRVKHLGGQFCTAVDPDLAVVTSNEANLSDDDAITVLLA
jgi:hypothetical protein